ncbi:hypothetical protein [Streptomyces sp. MBT33]|uniref:hypothetical protein n=1 Tax=Streptomyces sp. MBT33 TaxID=1488363 RepID=UPI00190987B5|nr:hypothetical protein [Streptomyces sp. MBT33]MBK3642963.1 hypothetical protein [Streptomyces sp. MBT33]
MQGNLIGDVSPQPALPRASSDRLDRNGPRERLGDSLVSCRGSLTIVDLLRPAIHLSVMEAGEGREPDERLRCPFGTVALF